MSPPIAFIYLRETPAETVKMASYQYVEGSIPAHSPFPWRAMCGELAPVGACGRDSRAVNPTPT